jgi:hypothetical protein
MEKWDWGDNFSKVLKRMLECEKEMWDNETSPQAREISSKLVGSWLGNTFRNREEQYDFWYKEVEHGKS